ncbi:MAG TPA: peptidoglycan editing factor PgeF [Myxococcaceae bacterium]|nr:peptidoglycan editing factor PgeF [Myxococcaceae bacterium]
MAVDVPLFLVARGLPVRHGFTLREGGVSEGKRATLDLGPAANAGADVHENRARLARAVGLPSDRLVLAEQVHGAAVVRASPGTVPEADALWTDAPDAWIGIRTADCVPLLLCSDDGLRVAAVHSGWRGTAARIAGAAVAELGRAGTRAGRLHAAIGPAIGVCCYEVSDDLAHRFAEAFGAEVARRDGERPHLDLRLAVRRTLIAAGVPEAHIEDVPGCNACDGVRFFSHRRDRGGTGRHLAFIAPGLVS